MHPSNNATKMTLSRDCSPSIYASLHTPPSFQPLATLTPPLPALFWPFALRHRGHSYRVLAADSDSNRQL